MVIVVTQGGKTLMAHKKLVLVGNPNVGKSVFFQALTGIYVDVSNFPGTTVDISRGKYKDLEIIDTPGVYGISSFNDEERVTRDVVIQADVILNVVDAVHLDRDLFLTQQLIDLGKPLVIALNMMDDVKRNGLDIDIDKLSSMLGVPVYPTVATKKIGLTQVFDNLGQATVGTALPILNKMEQELAFTKNSAERLLFLEDDSTIVEKYASFTDVPPCRDEIYHYRRERINQIVDETVTETSNGASFKAKLSRWMLQPLTGFPLLFAALAVMYVFLGYFIAQTVVGITEEQIMGTYYYNFIMGIFTPLFSQGSFWYDFFIGEFGVLTMVPIYILGLLLPLVIGFYFLLAILEDSGYLPRIATLVDRGMMRIGLNGRAIIPIILGFGCITMASISTRILGSKRERFIATLLLGLAIPCSAQLGVIITMASSLGMGYILIFVLSIFLVFGITGMLLDKIMPGESTDLLIDIPPLRIPRLNNILSKTWSKTVMFLKEASPLFALGGVLITVLRYFNILTFIENATEGIIVSILKLPKEVATSFIMGIIRRDFGAAGLFSLADQGMLTSAQTLVSLVVITLFVPCIAAVLIIFKERGWKDAAIIWVGSFVISFLAGGILAHIII